MAHMCHDMRLAEGAVLRPVDSDDKEGVLQQAAQRFGSEISATPGIVKTPETVHSLLGSARFSVGML